MLSQHLEELQSELLSNPENAPEILSDALESLHASIEDMKGAKKVLKYQNEDCFRPEEESTDTPALAHALQVHQIELEMQNEELRRAKLEMEEALAKYSDLYDFSPIGLFILDTKGLILEANLAGAALLGTTRGSLINKCFRYFVALKDHRLFDDFCKSAFENPANQTCELSLLKYEGSAIYVHIEGRATEDGPTDEKQFRIAIIDITEHKAG